MTRFFHRANASIAILAVTFACRMVLAHPGHGLLAPLPTWRLSDGRAISAYLMKSEDGRAWLVDEAGETQTVAVADLDETGRQDVRRFNSRLRIVNRDPTCET